MNSKDTTEIDALTARFFSLFTNTAGNTPRVDEINDMFIPTGIIINNTGNQPQIYSLESFITPRKELLSNGTLLNFSEWETSHKTDVFGNIAQRYVCYAKSGKLNGVNFETTGVKNIQFIKIDGQWKMVSVTWYDEP